MLKTKKDGDVMTKYTFAVLTVAFLCCYLALEITEQ